MPRPTLRRRLAALTMLGAASLAAAPSAADPDAGAYLAGRQALIGNDFDAAASFLVKAMLRDADDPALMSAAIGALIRSGDVPRAATVAERLIEIDDDNQFANLVLATRLARDGDWDALAAAVDGGELSSIPLFDGLAAAWALIGADRPEEAWERFDALSEVAGLRAFAIYHKALAHGALGRFEEAAELLGGGEDLRLSRRGSLAHIQILTRLDRFEEARAVLDAAQAGALDAVLSDLGPRLDAREVLDFDVAPDARAGMAEAAFSIANALAVDQDPAFTLVYARLVEALREDHVEGALLSAVLLEELGQYDLAIAVYRAVPRDHPAFDAAELGRAETLQKAGRDEAAIEVMRQLAGLRPDVGAIHATLGDALRELERFDEAREAYDTAIDLFEDDPRWYLHFARAITHERTDGWEAAEADFRRALELNPEQPQVLNYLGYSLVERQENLDEALDMIERAVASRPESGYIVDSLGWVLYRLGRYDEAVEPMEKAVELLPIDPVVNDHLGDVYWAVGRTLEARFQWSRALSFAENDQNDEVEPDRIRRKLEVGLDAVLAEEGSEPLRVADEDG